MQEELYFQSSLNKKGKILCLFFCLMLSCQSQEDAFTYKVIIDNSGGFGYQIYQFDKKLIEQPFIPVIDTIKGFQSKQDAVKVAKLVIMKIQSGERPPSITLKDLDSLKIAH